MREILSSLLSITTLVFAITSMFSVGCSYTIRQILDPLRDVGVIARVLVANFVLVPLLAFAILQLVSLNRPEAVGLLLLASAAGAPFLIKLTQAARGNMALSATLLVLLVPVTVVYIPLVVPALFPEATVSAMSIGTPLFLSMLLPLAMGLFFRAKSSRVAERLQPIMVKTSTLALVTLLALTIFLNFREISTFGKSAILSGFLLIAGAFVIGYALASQRPGARAVLGLGTAQRNIAAAMVVATQSFDDPNTMVMVVLMSILTIVLLFPTAWALRKWSGADRPIQRAA
jgi:BASS family bile acid:Na+ symporter